MRAATAGARRRDRAAGAFAAGFALFCAASLLLVPLLGRDFFPSVDAGQIRVHLRAPAGTRLEQTEQIVARVERVIRETLPPNEIEGILDNIGIPSRQSRRATTRRSASATARYTSRSPGHRPTDEYVALLRERLNREFPDDLFLPPADIVGQILNFGLPAPIDVQVSGATRPANCAVARGSREDPPGARRGGRARAPGGDAPGL